jgi:hypothetical protein
MPGERQEWKRSCCFPTLFVKSTAFERKTVVNQSFCRSSNKPAKALKNRLKLMLAPLWKRNIRHAICPCFAKLVNGWIAGGVSPVNLRNEEHVGHPMGSKRTRSPASRSLTLDPPGTAPAWRVIFYTAMLSISRVLPSFAATRMRRGPSLRLVTGISMTAWRTAT